MLKEATHLFFGLDFAAQMGLQSDDLPSPFLCCSASFFNVGQPLKKDPFGCSTWHKAKVETSWFKIWKFSWCSLNLCQFEEVWMVAKQFFSKSWHKVDANSESQLAFLGLHLLRHRADHCVADGHEPRFGVLLASRKGDEGLTFPESIGKFCFRERKILRSDPTIKMCLVGFYHVTEVWSCEFRRGQQLGEDQPIGEPARGLSICSLDEFDFTGRSKRLETTL